MAGEEDGTRFFAFRSSRWGIRFVSAVRADWILLVAFRLFQRRPRLGDGTLSRPCSSRVLSATHELWGDVWSKGWMGDGCRCNGMVSSIGEVGADRMAMMASESEFAAPVWRSFVRSLQLIDRVSTIHKPPGTQRKISPKQSSSFIIPRVFLLLFLFI